MVGVSASVNLPLNHKVQKFSSGTSSPGWSREKGDKMVVVWWWWCYGASDLEPLTACNITNFTSFRTVLKTHHDSYILAHLIHSVTNSDKQLKKLQHSTEQHNMTKNYNEKN